MRTRLAVTLIAAALVLLPACRRHPGTAADHHESRTFAAAPGKVVQLDVGSLDVDVEVTTGESIEWDVTLASRSSSSAAARRWVERNTPRIDDSPSRLEISTPRRTGVSVIGFIRTEGTLRLKLPAQCALEVHTTSGDVTLAGAAATLATPVRIETTSGDVTVEGGARELLLETSSGDVTVGGPALSVLEANTSSGTVRLESGADRAVVETSSGDAELRRLTGSLAATTSSGDVEADWSRLAAGSAIRVETTSGDVTLELPAGAVLSGELRTSSGTIQSEFPGEEGRRGRRLTLAATPAEAGRPPAAAGSAEVTVKTGSGMIALSKGKAVI